MRSLCQKMSRSMATQSAPVGADLQVLVHCLNNKGVWAMLHKGFLLACVTGLAAMVVSVPAHAAERGWVPSTCGAEPDAPAVDASSVEKYNASVDKVSAYEKAARTYNACVSKTAVKEETAISNEARDKIAHIHEGSSAVQQRISANFTQLTSALKAGGAKLQKAAH